MYGSAMKNFSLFLLMFFLLSACASWRNEDPAKDLEAQNMAAYKQKVSLWKEQKLKGKVKTADTTNRVEIVPYIKGQKPSLKRTRRQTTVADIEEEIRYKQYKDKYARLIDNVIVKKQSEDGITYEYSDARVDELAFMAVQYCKEQDRKKAFLNKITLVQNKARQATFDCRRL